MMVSDPVTIWTLDWVPDSPRGFVRDIRLRWACEEAGIPYRVATIPFDALPDSRAFVERMYARAPAPVLIAEGFAYLSTGETSPRHRRDIEQQNIDD